MGDYTCFYPLLNKHPNMTNREDCTSYGNTKLRESFKYF